MFTAARVVTGGSVHRRTQPADRSPHERQQGSIEVTFVHVVRRYGDR